MVPKLAPLTLKSMEPALRRVVLGPDAGDVLAAASCGLITQVPTAVPNGWARAVASVSAASATNEACPKAWPSGPSWLRTTTPTRSIIFGFMSRSMSVSQLAVTSASNADPRKRAAPRRRLGRALAEFHRLSIRPRSFRTRSVALLAQRAQSAHIKSTLRSLGCALVPPGGWKTHARTLEDKALQPSYLEPMFLICDLL